MLPALIQGRRHDAPTTAVSVPAERTLRPGFNCGMILA
jgi:hypothetical protein